MIRILIVEDDPNIARTMQATLEIGGYQTSICSDGSQAVETVAREPFDLILLDIMLPGTDGFSVLEQIRYREIPVIFLTALQDVTDKVRGLRLGAEDYIVKPFEALELLARIEVVLRRYRKEETVLRHGDLEIDLNRHTATQRGKEILLTPKEFDLAAFLVRNTEVAVTRERLLSAVWGYAYQGESRTVDIHVRQIRKKLHWEADLVTVPKLGYRLESRPAEETS